VETPIAESLRSAGIPIHAAPLRSGLDIKGMRALRGTLTAAAPAIVHAWGPAAVRASRLASGGRTVATAASFSAGGVSGWLATRRLRRVDRVVAATWAEGERYRRLGVPGDRLTHISPGVEAPPVPVERATVLHQLGLPANAQFIAVAGKLESQSGFKAAIWAFDMVRYDHPDWHLVIFGDGPQREPLEDFARALMFDDCRVHFVSSRADFPALLAHAGVVWVTQERGGLSPALEAMAAGVPVVAWKTGDLTEVLEDGQTGFLVPPSDRAKLSVRTYPLLDDPAARMKLGAAGRVRAAEHFSTRHAIEQYVRLYDEVAT
jgi:glycosyltransferase involved in cell wall biosynthesis